MEYKVHLKELVIFELTSFLGRTFLSGKPHLSEGNNYLNLGCGNNLIEGYVNADFFRFSQVLNRNPEKRIWQMDLRYPLTCDNESFDGIYSEHTLEHLYPDDVRLLLHELYRILKKDSMIRITVPDLGKYIDYYNGDHNDLDVEIFNERFKTSCSAVRNVTQNFLHLSVWDFEELKLYLEEVGFKNIKKMSCNESCDEKMKIDLGDRKWETLYVEAIKR